MYLHRWLPHGFVGHNAAAAGMKEGLPRPLETAQDSLDSCLIVAAGCVDDTVRKARLFRKQADVFKKPNHRVDSERGNRISFRSAANQTTHLVAATDQRRRDRAANESTGTRHEDFQIGLRYEPKAVLRLQRKRLGRLRGHGRVVRINP